MMKSSDKLKIYILFYKDLNKIGMVILLHSQEINFSVLLEKMESLYRENE